MKLTFAWTLVVVQFLIISALLAGCSSQGRNGTRPYQAPDYAFSSGTSWIVQCDDGSRSIIQDYRISTFYKRDGTQYTKEEFCDR
jgi:hypothetical protein